MTVLQEQPRVSMTDKLDLSAVFPLHSCPTFGVGISGMSRLELGRNMDIIAIYYLNRRTDFFLIKTKDCFIKIDQIF